jgi:hypothetical protein
MASLRKDRAPHRVAAILASAVPSAGQTVAVITGRNITLDALAAVLQSHQLVAHHPTVEPLVAL